MIVRVAFPVLFYVLAAAMALSACSGIDLGDNPGKDVPKDIGPLTNLPDHLKDGSR